MEDITGITRVEVIDWRDGVEEARKFVLGPTQDSFEVELSFQDEGRTLKVFLKDED